MTEGVEKPRSCARMLVVDDDQAFRQSVCSIAGQGDRQNVVEGADSLSGARRRLAVGAFDVALVGAQLADGFGVDLVHEIASSRPDAPMMIVAVFGDKRRLLAGLEAASAVWLDDEDAAAEPPHKQVPPYGLSERELEVVHLLCKGYSVGEVADLLGVKSHTAATHVKHIYRKMGVTSRAMCIYEASRVGLMT